MFHLHPYIYYIFICTYILPGIYIYIYTYILDVFSYKPPYFYTTTLHLNKNNCPNLQIYQNTISIYSVSVPIPSMYGIFAYIYRKNQPNVGRYTSPMDVMGYIYWQLSTHHKARFVRNPILVYAKRSWTLSPPH